MSLVASGGREMSTNIPTSASELSKCLHGRSFLLYCFARVSTTLAYQMLSVAIGWQIYNLTKSAFYLGMVGLVQFLPMVMLTLIVGHVADRYNRRLVTSSCQLIEGSGILVLAVGSYAGWLNKESILAIMFLLGAVRSFESPTLQALMPGLMPAEFLPRAAAWSASATQTAVIIGPALGGFSTFLAQQLSILPSACFFYWRACSFSYRSQAGTVNQ